MTSPIKIPVTASDQTGGAFKSVEAGIASMRQAARTATQAMGTVRRSAGDAAAAQGALASMYGKSSQAATAAAAQTRSYGGALGFVKGQVGALIPVMTAAAAVSLGANIVTDIDRLQDLSNRYGVAAGTLSEYGYAAKLTGTDIETLANGIKFSQRSLSDAARGGRESAEAIRYLGLNVHDLRAMRPEDAFEAIGDAISRPPSEVDRTNYFVKMFGRTGADLIPAFEGGAEGLRKLRTEARQYGAALDSDVIARTALAADAVDRMSLSLRGLAQQLVVSVAPAVSRAADKITAELEFDRAKSWMNTLSEAQQQQYAGLFTGVARYFKGLDHYKPLIEDYRAYLLQMKAISAEFVAAGTLNAPLLPGLTDAGQEEQFMLRRAKLEREQRAILASLKNVAPLDIFPGVSAEDADKFKAMFESYSRASTASKESAHQDWLVGQLMPTDQEAEEAARAGVERHLEAVRAATAQYQQLKRESTTTWKLMNAGIENVTDQLSYNMGAALAGIRTKLLDLKDLAGQLLSMAIRLGINAAVNAIFPGASAAVPGLQGPTPGGAPLGSLGKALSSMPIPPAGQSVKIENVNIRGILDPTDKLGARRVVTALYEEIEKVFGHIGPRGAAA